MPRRPTATTAVGLFDSLDDSQRQKSVFVYSDPRYNCSSIRIIAKMLFCRDKSQRRFETPQRCHPTNHFPGFTPLLHHSSHTYTYLDYRFVIMPLGGATRGQYGCIKGQSVPNQIDIRILSTYIIDRVCLIRMTLHGHGHDDELDTIAQQMTLYLYTMMK